MRKFNIGDKVRFKHQSFSNEHLSNIKHPLAKFTDRVVTVDGTAGPDTYYLRNADGQTSALVVYERELTLAQDVTQPTPAVEPREKVVHTVTVNVVCLTSEHGEKRYRGEVWLDGVEHPGTCTHMTARKAMFWAMYLYCNDKTLNLFDTVFPEVK